MQPGVAAGLRLGFLRSPPLPSTAASLNPLKELTEKLSFARAVLLPAQVRPVYPMGRRRGIDVTEDELGAWGMNTDGSNQKVTVSIGTMGGSAPTADSLSGGGGSAGSRIAGRDNPGVLRPSLQSCTDSGLQRHG